MSTIAGPRALHSDPEVPGRRGRNEGGTTGRATPERDSTGGKIQASPMAGMVTLGGRCAPPRRPPVPSAPRPPSLHRSAIFSYFRENVAGLYDDRPQPRRRSIPLTPCVLPTCTTRPIIPPSGLWLAALSRYPHPTSERMRGTPPGGSPPGVGRGGSGPVDRVRHRLSSPCDAECLAGGRPMNFDKDDRCC